MKKLTMNLQNEQYYSKEFVNEWINKVKEKNERNNI